MANEEKNKGKVKKMREIAVIGIGQTKVDEHWDKSMRELAGEAALAALADARRESPAREARGRRFPR